MTDQHYPAAPGQPEVPGDHTQEIPRHEPTREIPVTHQDQPYAAPGQYPTAPTGPDHASGGTAYVQGPDRRGRGSRGWWQVPTAAIAAALLASGGTAALMSHRDGDTGGTSSAAAPTSLSTSLNTQAPLDQGATNAPDWKATSTAVSPSVVAISVQDSSGNGGEGSGVILDAQGHIVTNNHVVGESGQGSEIVVTLSDQRAFKASVVGLDPSTDLAVIKLQGNVRDLKPVAVGNSDALKVGDPVMAVGNPLGLSGTVTTGIVSALNRPVTTQQQSQQQDPMGGLFGQQQQSGNEVITNAIQTSAPINPGNSGGALVNANGQLVGINSSIASLGSSGGQSGSIGIGFAIPVNEVTSITGQLIAHGKAEHAFLGVSAQTGLVQDGSDQRVASIVSSVVAGSPADKAGIKARDAIISIDGEPVTGSQSLVAQVRERRVGDKARLVYLRGGKRTEVTVTFAQKTTN